MIRAVFAIVVLLLPVSVAAQDPAPLPPITDADREAAFPDVEGHALHDS